MRTEPTPEAQKYELSCAAFAALNQVKAQTVRVRLCLMGHYYGVRPLKLANGRLAFPAVQVTTEGRAA